MLWGATLHTGCIHKEEENHKTQKWYMLPNLKKIHILETLGFFLVVHTGSTWSMETFLPPLLRSLNVPCTFKKVVRKIDKKVVREIDNLYQRKRYIPVTIAKQQNSS